MKKMTLFISLLLMVLPLYAAETYPPPDRKNIKQLSTKQIDKMDKRLNKQKAKSRKFHTQKEYIRQHVQYKKPYSKSIYRPKQYENVYDEYLVHLPYTTPVRQRGYRYPKRGWELAYRYDRAEFFDRYGYHYGYFNRHGYYFEGIFYRYDRGYTYNDRVRGRGLFERRYYMPVNAEYYGFSAYPYRGF